MIINNKNNKKERKQARKQASKQERKIEIVDESLRVRLCDSLAG